MAKLEGKDVFSILVVICATILLMSGVDTVVGITLLGIVAGYYGIDLTPWIGLGRKRKKKGTGG